MKLDKKVLNQLKTIVSALESAKPENGYFWDDEQPDCLRRIDNTIDELENIINNALEYQKELKYDKRHDFTRN